MVTIPLDQCPIFNKMVDTFGGAHRFQRKDVEAIFGIKENDARKLLATIRSTLADCPDGVQLKAQRGAAYFGGGWYFN